MEYDNQDGTILDQTMLVGCSPHGIVTFEIPGLRFRLRYLSSSSTKSIFIALSCWNMGLLVRKNIWVSTLIIRGLNALARSSHYNNGHIMSLLNGLQFRNELQPKGRVTDQWLSFDN